MKKSKARAGYTYRAARRNLARQIRKDSGMRWPNSWREAQRSIADIVRKSA